MAHRDTKTELIYVALRMVFPCTGAVPIAPTAVCTDQQGVGLGVAMPTHSLPPSPDTLDGKLSSVVGDSNVHEAFVALRIIGSVVNGLLLAEVVDVHLLGIALLSPISAGILEVSDLLLLLGV